MQDNRVPVLEPEEDVPEGETRLYAKSNIAHTFKIRYALYYIDILAPILHFYAYDPACINQQFAEVIADELNAKFNLDLTGPQCLAHFRQIKKEANLAHELIELGDLLYDGETGLFDMEPVVREQYAGGMRPYMPHDVEKLFNRNMMDVAYLIDLLRRREKPPTKRQMLKLEEGFNLFWDYWRQKAGLFMGKPGQAVPKTTPKKSSMKQKAIELSSSSSSTTPQAQLQSPMDDHKPDLKTFDPLQEEKRQRAVEGIIRLYSKKLVTLSEAVHLSKGVCTGNTLDDTHLFQDAPDELLAAILTATRGH